MEDTSRLIANCVLDAITGHPIEDHEQFCKCALALLQTFSYENGNTAWGLDEGNYLARQGIAELHARFEAALAAQPEADDFQDCPL